MSGYLDIVAFIKQKVVKLDLGMVFLSNRDP